MSSPFSRDFFERIAGKDAATATRDDAVLRVPFAGVVTVATFIPDAPLTGVDTNSAKLSLINKGSTGAGTSVVATKSFVSGVNGAGHDELSLTVSTTLATVAEGDVLALSVTKEGSGLTTPAGLLKITVARSE